MKKEVPSIISHVSRRPVDDTVDDNWIYDDADYGGDMEEPEIESMSIYIVVVKFRALNHMLTP